MIQGGIEAFAGKNVLLLQGPVGPFFARLARDLRQAGATVFKINFNAGDWLFYPSGAHNYRGTMEDWPAFFREQVRAWQIDTVLLFGDCRPIHRAAHTIATEMKLEIGVFEEGYIRPNYITLERFGVNDNSRLPRTVDIRKEEPPETPHALPVTKPYWHMIRLGFLYFGVGALGKPWFPHYRHHRPLSLLEGLFWIRALWRKWWYRWKERGMQDRLTGQWKDRFFLVPLQVHNDAQIIVHADLGSIPHFIEMTIQSFVRHAPSDTILVFKHHPMDRGYSDYTKLIRQIAQETGVTRRVHYVHDLHVPTLLNHARGVVVINSTVGLSAIHHGTPTKVCGRALYDMRGLTFQGRLDRFWKAAAKSRPDQELYKRFRKHLIARTQLNGNFYRPLKMKHSACGLVWRAWPTPPQVQAGEDNINVVSVPDSRLQGVSEPEKQ